MTWLYTSVASKSVKAGTLPPTCCFLPEPEFWFGTLSGDTNDGYTIPFCSVFGSGESCLGNRGHPKA